MSADPRFCLGIDLGTSNSALACLDLSEEGSPPAILEIPQVTGPKAIDGKRTLASVTYLPHEDEFQEGLPALPWQKEGERRLRGQFARDHGAMIPDRVITSAKSWLSNPHVDPRSDVLPWKREDVAEGDRLSALAVSRGYLAHIKEAWISSPWAQERNGTWEEVAVVITVPASFDEVARNLTLEAAEMAGYGDVVLLEEPLAAFYAWTESPDSNWQKQVSEGDVVLVCDVGGGTADFSLIAMGDEGGKLELERVSVGEHLLLGGDNMDLALAYTLRAQLEGQGKKVDDGQFLSLHHGARKAKEQLLEDDALSEVPIVLPSRGARLFGNTMKVKLDRSTLEAVVLNGFFPSVEVTTKPESGAGSGLQEFGLPYAADPVVTKHLAQFLCRSRENVAASEELQKKVSLSEGDALFPSGVLFNGGVFRSGALRKRIQEVISEWSGSDVRELTGFEPDLAVAQGAAVYARNRAGGTGLRIRAGLSRSYYLGLETSMPAIPGFQPPLKGVCVVPQGMEEGQSVDLPDQEFGLVTGGEAKFRFFSSEVRSGDEPGGMVANASEDLEETAQLTVTLPAAEGMPAGERVPVRLQAVVTELGALELWMQHTQSDQRWKLEFAVRES
ncbi:MAG: Hsp70 family protein [Verrucomicrobiota bacterium]